MRLFQVVSLAYGTVVALLYVLGQSNLEFLRLLSSGILPVTSGVLMLLAFLVFGSSGGSWQHALSRVYLSVAVATFLLFLGDLLKSFSNLGFNAMLPSSLVDVLYLGEYVMFLSALIWVLFMFEKAIVWRNIVIASLVGVVVAAAVSYVLVFPLLTYQGSLLDLILRLAYPFLVLFLFAISFLVFLVFFGGELGLAWCFITVGILFHALGDLSYVYTNLHSLYFTGHPLEILWLMSYVFLIIGLEMHRRQFKL